MRVVAIVLVAASRETDDIITSIADHTACYKNYWVKTNLVLNSTVIHASLSFSNEIDYLLIMLAMNSSVV